MQTIDQTIQFSEFIVPYCERIVSGSEPFNTWSNMAFILAGVYGLMRFPCATWQPRLLVLLPFLIGTGSAMFHARPSLITHALDLIPIIIFSILLNWLIMRSAGWSLLRAIIILVVWAIASGVAAQWPQVLAQSLFYVPTVVLLLGLSVFINNQGRLLWWLLLIFTTALIARALDLVVCGSVSVGTHSLWHLLAAIACGIGIHMALARNQPAVACR